MGGSSSKGYKWLRQCEAESGFSPDEAKRIFAEYDKNRDDVLDRKEAEAFFQDYCKAKNVTPNKAELARLFSLFDRNNDGNISWEELSGLSMPGLSRHKSTELKRQQSRGKAANLVTKPAEEKKSQLDPLFDTYAHDPDYPDAVYETGLSKFFEDLGVVGEDTLFVTLLTMYKLQCATTGEISRAEFKKGFSDAKCKDLDDIKNFINREHRLVKDNPKLYEKFYLWCFDFYLDSDDCKKTLEPTFAEEGWLALLKWRWELYPQWAAFIQKQQEPPKSLKQIRRDVWDELYFVSRDLRADLSNLAEADQGCWPTLIDEFIAYLQAERAAA